MTINFNSTFQLFFVFLLIVSTGFVFFFYKLFFKYKIQNRKLLLKLAQCQTILKMHPVPWCSWIDGETYINAPSSFKKLFRFDTNQPLRLSDLMAILDDSNQSVFKRSLQHILDFGGNFTIEVDLFDNSKHFEIFGCCYENPREDLIQNNDNNGPVPSMFILSVRDITKNYDEKQKLQAIHQKTYEELTVAKTMNDMVPMAIWFRNQSGRISACNQTYAASLETTVHSAIAENRELTDRYGEVSTYDLSKKAIESGVKTVMRAHVVIGGQRKYLEISEIPLSHTGETVGYAVDITTMEELEKELKVTIQSQKEVLNYLSTPVAIYGPDTRLIFFNSCYVTMFEQDESWLLTKPTLLEIMDNLRDQRKMPEYTNFLEHKQSRLNLFKTLLEPMHEIMHQPDGIICRLVIAPTPDSGLVYVFDNITDKLMLERRYNTLTAVQKETIDHLYEGIIVFGTDYRLRLSNPAMERIWNISTSKRIEGTHINEILKVISPQFKTPKESKTWRMNMLDIVSRRYPERQRIRLKKDKVLEYSYVPLPDGSHLLSFIDVSDTWRFEKSLQERNLALEHEDRLKSDFIAHVSYELRSPLNTITGFNEILMNQYFGELNEKQLDYCKGIHDASDRLMKLINDMLDLASIESDKLKLNYQNINVEEFLNSVLVLVQNRANDHGLELIIDNKVGDCDVIMDTRRIKHALFNLLTNAIKFTPCGGRVTLHVMKNTENQDIEFIVEDTGVGIPETERKKILGLFKQDLEGLGKSPQNDIIQNGISLHDDQHRRKRKQRTNLISPQNSNVNESENEDANQNKGLGLALVKNLVELHGGKIFLDSEIDKGTSVRFSIPLDPLKDEQVTNL